MRTIEMRSRGTRTRNVSRSGRRRYLDWQPRYLVSKTGGFTSRPHDRFAFFSLCRCSSSSSESPFASWRVERSNAREERLHVAGQRLANVIAPCVLHFVARAASRVDRVATKSAETRAVPRYGARSTVLPHAEKVRASDTHEELVVASRRQQLVSILCARAFENARRLHPLSRLQLGGTAVRRSDDLEQVPVRVFEVDAAAAEVMIDAACLSFRGIGPNLARALRIGTLKSPFRAYDGGA